MLLEERAKILIVDDVPQNIELLQAMLTLGGYEVLTASDGEQAVKIIHREAPDLLLLDAMMPRSSGYELCLRLKSDMETMLLPVLLLIPSGKEDRLRAIEAGSDDFLERPPSRIELMARVESLLRTKHLRDEMVSLEDAVMALATAIEAKDPYIEGHLERISTYTLNLGKELGLSQRELTMLKRGSILHDVGKIGVGEAVLLKPGPLTAEEFEQVKLHPIIREQICQPLRAKLISNLVRHHHERYDGKGYPDGLKGEDIPLAARIMSLADAYDAMTSERPYRTRMPRGKALAVLREEAGKQFDPALASIFVDMMQRSSH